MKRVSGQLFLLDLIVAPHAGAWIETGLNVRELGELVVAPHAGAWIETITCKSLAPLPLVAPHAGAWIETIVFPSRPTAKPRRPSRRGVD